MPLKSKRKRLTDADRHKRFVAMARELGTSENPKDFDQAFKRITKTRKTAKPSKQ